MALRKLKWLKYLFIGRTEAETEQEYWDKKRRKHIANEHSEGIVAGLDVTQTSPVSLSVQIHAGRAVDTDGNDPEIESVQEIDCTSLVPVSGTTTIYFTLRYNDVETEPYFVDEIGTYQNKYVQDSYHLEVTTEAPSDPSLELARVELSSEATEILDAADPKNPSVNEIDLRYVKHTGKEVLAFRDLSDIDEDEADAFNGMNEPSGQNPIATMDDVLPTINEVETARGSKATLDERLDVALDEEGNLKAEITGHSALTDMPDTEGANPDHDARYIKKAGDAMTGDLAMAAGKTVDGRDVSEDGAKLDGIEGGATEDLTAGEVLALIKTVDGEGSGLDADLLDGAQHKGEGGGEHAIVTPSVHGFMSATDKGKLNGIEGGATADLTPAEILALLKTVDGGGSGLDADLLDGQEASYYDPSDVIAVHSAQPSVHHAEFTPTQHDARNHEGIASVLSPAEHGNMNHASVRGVSGRKVIYNWCWLSCHLTTSPAQYNMSIYSDDYRILWVHYSVRCYVRFLLGSATFHLSPSRFSIYSTFYLDQREGYGDVPIAGTYIQSNKSYDSTTYYTFAKEEYRTWLEAGITSPGTLRIQLRSQSPSHTPSLARVVVVGIKTYG